LQTSGTTDHFRSVDFIDANNGWAVGNMGAIVHTTNGGATWTTQNSGTEHALLSVAFLDANTGWAAGAGTIVHTTDGGATWSSQFIAEQGSIRDLSFVDAGHGWAVGDNGTILRYNPTLRAPDERSVHQPSLHSLACYPNPFNPTITIAYDLPKAGHISLRVFDLLGRDVAVLKDGFVEAGTHRVTFDGSALATGIYFARLDAGKFSQTKKLMLLK
jgi:hypothetical protein